MCSDPGQDLIKERHPEARREPRRRRRVLADHARAHVPQGRLRRGPQPVPAPDGQRARTLLVGHRGQGRGHREGQAHPQCADPPPAVQRGAGSHRGAGQPRRAGRRRRHRRHRGGAQAVRHRQEGLSRREAAEHRRPHGDVRQDLPDARLRRLHPNAEDVGRWQGPQHRDARLQRGRTGRGLRRQLQGQGAQEGALREHRHVQWLRRLHRGVRGAQGAERVRPGPRQAQRRLHPVPAGRPAARHDRRRQLPHAQGQEVQAALHHRVRPGRHRLRAAGRGHRPRGRRHHHGDRLRALGPGPGPALWLRQARQRHQQPRVRAHLQRVRPHRRRTSSARTARRPGRSPSCTASAAATRTTRSSARACAACTRSSSATSSRSTCPTPRCTSCTSTCAATARATRSSTGASWTRACTWCAAAPPRSPTSRCRPRKRGASSSRPRTRCSASCGASRPTW